MEGFALNVLRFWGWSSWRFWGLIPTKLWYFWIFFDAAYALDVLVCRNALERLLFIGVWGWVSDTWWISIGDMCCTLIKGALRLFLQDTWHLLIGQNVLIFKVTHVSTRLDWLCHRLHASSCLCHCLHSLMCDWFLHAFYAPISMTLGKFLLVFE